MSAQHTPGPWEISDDPYECNDYRIVIRHGQSAALIATVGNMGATSDHKPTAKRWKAESPANARLLAAAPELLAALEHILKGALSLPRFAEEEARAAIAKARGQSGEGEG